MKAMVLNHLCTIAENKKPLMLVDMPQPVPEHLWQEKELKSVANVARTDVMEFLQLAAKIQIKPQALALRERCHTSIFEIPCSKFDIYITQQLIGRLSAVRTKISKILFGFIAKPGTMDIFR